MTRHETNKSNMHNSVISLFDEEAQIQTEFSVFTDPVTRLKGTALEIKEIDKKYLSATGGKTAAKNNAEDDLLEDLMPVKSALYALAAKTNNEELKVLTADSEWTLKKMRDADFLKKAEAIKEKAQNNLADLAPYKISEAVLSELQEKIDAFDQALGGQDTGLADRSALRKQLSAKFDEADNILTEELDNLIELVRKSNRLFYDKYISARGIKDLGGSKKSDETKPGTENPAAPPAAGNS